MANRKAQIQEAFNDFKDLFESKTVDRVSIKSDSSGKELYVPYSVPMGTSDGLKLKEDVGYIAIQETIDDKGGVTSYRYKFFMPKCEYLVCAEGSGINSDHCGVFNFHYDKDENDKPHTPHVTVLFPSIRYVSREIGLKDFLFFIKEHFFENQQGSLCKKNFNLWDSRS